MDRVIRVKSWQEFKCLAINLKPKSVVYNIEQNGLSPERELTCLRLIMPTKEIYYIFLDFPREDKLRETGIPIRKDRKGNQVHRRQRGNRFSENPSARETNIRWS